MAGGDTSNFDIGEVLGEGAFGKVYACFDKNDNDKKVGCPERYDQSNLFMNIDFSCDYT